MMATKEQEKKALEQIKKILEGLDEDGYVRTAMLGVIEDAEDNIKNDWACSRYDAWQSAEQKLEKANAALVELSDKAIALQKRVSWFEKNTLNPMECATAQRILNEYREGQARTLEGYTNTVLEYCETPDHEAFKIAVRGRKQAAARIADVDVLIGKLDR